jgi:hypothetical protein
MDSGGGIPIARIFADRIINFLNSKGENIFGQLSDHPPYQTQLNLTQTCSIIIPYHVLKLTESNFHKRLYSISFYILVAGEKKNRPQYLTLN